MSKIFNIIWIFLLPAFFAGCKDIYLPDIPSSATNFLVVEGVLNAGNEPTTITITRTYDIDGNIGNLRGEPNAIVTVEGNDNSTRPLTMTSAGTYQSNNLVLSANNEYRLRIKTIDGKEYLSSYVKVKASPEIDSVSYKRLDGDLQLYVNTHDPANNTRYYKWSYEETWEINSSYNSTLIYDKDHPQLVRERTPSELIFRCWKYSKSNKILFGSSAKLTSDIIFEQPLNLIPNGDERLSVKYSILLKQYAMDKDAYEFFDLMKKNTESLGSIFDAQPSEIRGNIQCVTNPDEIVIGYISASTVTQKRIFINRPEGWSFRQLCDIKLVPPNRDSIVVYLASGEYIPLWEEPRENAPAILDYASSTPVCVDCRERGGNLQRPAYW
ncbi:MAG: DUF4249 domain-containing protein [Niabella sp.]